MSSSPYKLYYWPSIPGRGEFIRLAFEYAKHPYEQDLDPKSLVGFMRGSTSTPDGGPSPLAPPFLEHDGHIISQTPNILLYISEELDLAGEKPIDKYYVHQLALTILDLNNEVHDSHHPVSVSDYYENQKPESLKKAKHIREERFPKFLAYFNTILSNSSSGYLVGSKASYADLCLFQVVDGIQFAFPKCLKKLEGEEKYAKVFEHKKKIEEGLKEYLKSDRRTKYGNGVFRYYPELDDQ